MCKVASVQLSPKRKMASMISHFSDYGRYGEEKRWVWIYEKTRFNNKTEDIHVLNNVN